MAWHHIRARSHRRRILFQAAVAAVATPITTLGSWFAIISLGTYPGAGVTAKQRAGYAATYGFGYFA